MKTVVQELIDDLLSGKITDTLAKSEYYLEKEKQQIIDDFTNGQCTVITTPTDYYDQTYKND